MRKWISLQQDTLQLLYNNQQDEIALLEKYNRNRKDLMTAFHTYYDFSPIVFWDMEANDY